MKCFKFTVLLAALLCAAGMSQAQTFQAGLDSLIKDGAIGGGYWRATKGNFTVYSGDYLYNITATTNGLSAGLILGVDNMRGAGVSVFNDVKGGFALNYKFNLAAIGLTNTEFKVYGGSCIATPRGGTAGVGNITFAGVDYSLDVYKSVVLHIDPAYQTRTGQGEFDRNYIGIQAFLSLGGGKASLLAADDLYLDQAYAMADMR